MDFSEAFAYISSIQERLGSDYSLREVKELARRVGNPEQRIKIVHIAGTNGKGSVGNYISNILAMAGYTVGRFISPTIFDYRERIQRVISCDTDKNCMEEAAGTDVSNSSCGQQSATKSIYMTEAEMADMVTRLKSVCGEMVAEGYHQPTAFEMETVMAFLLFEVWKVDVAIVECGLGGRLDATNIISNPLLCVFTSISRDHMKLLGDTVPAIAREKYGIIKEGTVVVSKYQPECQALLKEICHEKNAELIFMEEQKLQEQSFSVEKTVFAYKETPYEIGQGGLFQLENAALSVEAAWKLAENGFHAITEESIQKGLLASRWKGRFEVVSDFPFLLADGAHNEEAAKRLRDSLALYFPKEKFSFIIGVFRDKEYEKVLHYLMPLAQEVYAVKAPGPRGLESDILCESIRKQGILQEKIYDCGSMEHALSRALEENREGKTVVCGSLSILQEVYCFLDNYADK